MTPETDLPCRETKKKMVLHNALLQTRAKILYLLNLTAVLPVILNFTQRSSEVIFLRWILETRFPYLTPYQIKKNENWFLDRFLLL